MFFSLRSTIPAPPSGPLPIGSPLIGFLCVLPVFLYELGGVAGSFLKGTWVSSFQGALGCDLAQVWEFGD